MNSTPIEETPVKVYRSADRLTVAAPFPGLEPQDIQAHVTDDGVLVLEGRPRGVLKGQNEVLRDEWNAGPYFCRVMLDRPVDATLANATYENGVVVVSLPISERMRAFDLTLERVSRMSGRRYGQSGHSLRAAV